VNFGAECVIVAYDTSGDVTLDGGEGGSVFGSSASDSANPASIGCALPPARAWSTSAGGVGERWQPSGLVASTLSSSDEQTLAQVFTVSLPAASSEGLGAQEAGMTGSVAACPSARWAALLAAARRRFWAPLEWPSPGLARYLSLD
jgi:hypothetical protein